MKKKILKLFLYSFSMLIILCGCSSRTDEKVDLLTKIQEEGVLKIGTEGTYSPNSYHDENGELVGFDVEVGMAIADKLGVKAEFVESEWDSLFAAMDVGRIDIIVNEVEYSDERAEKYDFSEPYTYVHGALLVSNDNEIIQSFEDLEGMKAAQNLTSSWGILAESYGAELVGVNAMDQSIELLKTNRVDATLNAETAFSDYLRKHPNEPVKIIALTEETASSVIPVKKGNERLLEEINKAIAELKESGELKAISEKYFGIDVTKK